MPLWYGFPLYLVYPLQFITSCLLLPPCHPVHPHVLDHMFGMQVIITVLFFTLCYLGSITLCCLYITTLLDHIHLPLHVRSSLPSQLHIECMQLCTSLRYIIIVSFQSHIVRVILICLSELHRCAPTCTTSALSLLWFPCHCTLFRCNHFGREASLLCNY